MPAAPALVNKIMHCPTTQHCQQAHTVYAPTSIMRSQLAAAARPEPVHKVMTCDEVGGSGVRCASLAARGTPHFPLLRCKNDERRRNAKGRTKHNLMHKRLSPSPRAWGSSYSQGRVAPINRTFSEVLLMGMTHPWQHVAASPLGAPLHLASR